MCPALCELPYQVWAELQSLLPSSPGLMMRQESLWQRCCCWWYCTSAFVFLVHVFKGFLFVGAFSCCVLGSVCFFGCPCYLLVCEWNHQISKRLVGTKWAKTRSCINKRWSADLWCINQTNKNALSGVFGMGSWHYGLACMSWKSLQVVWMGFYQVNGMIEVQVAL